MFKETGHGNYETSSVPGPVTESSADRDESPFNSQTLIPGTIWPWR